MKTSLHALATLTLLCCTLPALAQHQLRRPAAQQLTAPDGTTVTITRDDFGVPHLVAGTEAALFFGQGYVTAQDRLYQVNVHRLVALGRLAELDPTALDVDIFTRTTGYTADERAGHLAALSPEMQAVIAAYTAGINAYVDSARANPDRYLCGRCAAFEGEIETWEATDVVAIAQFFARRFGRFGGEEMARLYEYNTYGPTWFEQHRPINDASLPTTIEPSRRMGKGSGVQPGSPDPAAQVSGLSQLPTLGEPRRVTWTRKLEGIHATLMRIEGALARLRIPKLGSYAVLVPPRASATGESLLLGAPQMGVPQAGEDAFVHEVELQSATMHVGGMTIAGMPGVIIGRTTATAWTFTSGLSDNTDTFIETLTQGDMSTYLYDNSERPFAYRTETFHPRGMAPVERTLYRSVHGPVVGDQRDAGMAFSWQMTFWQQEHQALDALYTMWKADDLTAFVGALPKIPINLNVFYTDDQRNIGYWHVGWLLREHQEGMNSGVDPRLPRLGDGSQEWASDPFLPLGAQPHVVNPSGFLTNWNNKPAVDWNNGDNIAWADTPDRKGPTFRVSAIQQHLQAFVKAEVADVRQVHRVVREADSYPGSYQQLIAFGRDGSWGENLVPPGQSGFMDRTGTPDANRDDQWAYYQDGTMKAMLFEGAASAVANEADADIPTAFVLHPNYPNPFNPTTTFAFTVDAPTALTLSVYDLLGRQVARVAEGTYAAGTHVVRFEATGLPSGTYFYRLASGASIQTRTFTLLR